MAWNWSDAFYKFGFNDGDDEIHTPCVAAALTEAGYFVRYAKWGAHNVVIFMLRKGGECYLPARSAYKNPRDYLPQEIITLLDTAFPHGTP